MAKILMIMSVLCVPSLVCAASNISIRIYTGSTINEYNDYPINSAEEVLQNSAWDSSKPVAIYAHGMDESVDAVSTVAIAEGFVTRGDSNFIAINYADEAKYSSINFVSAWASLYTKTSTVGDHLGGFINKLIAAGVPVSSFYLIGFSTGAHVVGHAARISDGKIPRITALDPTLGGWFFAGLDDHLWSTDATVVDVIHTNGGLMGVATTIGTVDFYPNSGYALQPGCWFHFSSDIFSCSTDASWKFYAESLKNPTAFEAAACSSWSEFEGKKCTGPTDHMGYGYAQKATGTMYLQTNNASPYSKGTKGSVYDRKSSNSLNAKVIQFFVGVMNRFF